MNLGDLLLGQSVGQDLGMLLVVLAILVGSLALLGGCELE